MKIQHMRQRLLGVGLLFLLSLAARAQFTPPPDPSVPVFYYALTAACDPVDAGTASGKGSYAPGTSVTVSTSAKAGFTFSHWTLNGERIEQPASFSYTTVAGPMDFVAHYNLTPIMPSDPTMNVKSRLYLTSEPEGICTFNRTSGAYVQADQYVTVNVTNSDQWYEFDGWYVGNDKVSDVQEFNYLTDYQDVTLTAHFRELPFTPALPGDPASQGENVQTHETGDVDEDGTVDITDAVAIINVYLTGNTEGINESMADVNGDGVIDITDAVEVINIYLKNN